MKNSKKQNFLMYSLTALTCTLFCSSPFWFPSLCSSMKVFLFVSLPKVGSVIISPKLLFIVGNLIVVVLIGESKFFASNSSPASKVYYDEYISKTTRSFERKEKLCYEENEKKICEDGENIVKKKLVEKVVVLESYEREELVGKDDNNFAFPAEDLSKRADDFIARVNRRRRVEARLLNCSGDIEKKNSPNMREYKRNNTL